MNDFPSNAFNEQAMYWWWWWYVPFSTYVALVRLLFAWQSIDSGDNVCSYLLWNYVYDIYAVVFVYSEKERVICAYNVISSLFHSLFHRQLLFCNLPSPRCQDTKTIGESNRFVHSKRYLSTSRAFSISPISVFCAWCSLASFFLFQFILCWYSLWSSLTTICQMHQYTWVNFPFQ